MAKITIPSKVPKDSRPAGVGYAHFFRKKLNSNFLYTHHIHLRCTWKFCNGSILFARNENITDLLEFTWCNPNQINATVKGPHNSISLIIKQGF